MSTHADFSADGTAIARRKRDQAKPIDQPKRVASTYRFNDLTSREAILAIQEDWQRLERVSEGSAVFQAFDLCLPWLDTYVFGDDPTHSAHILAFYDKAGVMVALAPLAQTTTGLVTLAKWIGEPLVQYGDLLMDPSVDPMVLRDAFMEATGTLKVDGLHLRNVRDDSRIATLLDLSQTAVGEPREAALADFTQFDDVDGYFGTFSKRSKKNRKTKRRKLAEHGVLTFETVKAGPQAAEFCDLALTWKLTWLAERGLSSRAFMDGRALATLKEACGRASDANPIHLFIQRVDGKPVAIEVGLLGPQGNAAFMGTYDPAYDALSAGKVQMESSVIHGFDQGWAAYDMLAPMSDYKRSWANRTVGVADHIIPNGFVGTAYRDGYLRGVRPAAKAAWAMLPATVRTFLLRKGGGLASL